MLISVQASWAEGDVLLICDASFLYPFSLQSATRILKPSSGGGLFGDDDEDDLFSTAKTNIPVSVPLL